MATTDSSTSPSTKTTSTSSTSSSAAVPSVPSITITDDASAEAAQSALDDYRRQQDEANAAARATKLRPLTDLFSSDGWTQSVATLAALTQSFTDEPFYDLMRSVSNAANMLPGQVK